MPRLAYRLDCSQFNPIRVLNFISRRLAYGNVDACSLEQLYFNFFLLIITYNYIN